VKEGSDVVGPWGLRFRVLGFLYFVCFPWSFLQGELFNSITLCAYGKFSLCKSSSVMYVPSFYNTFAVSVQ
jgi:hypothetical protein